ncbi:ubl carboxyl-terminal hydrolase 18-like [Anarhichas minor]|uniref:ubl carboxyl-terminal hydrolase 18-like n=1 Tax=Anarhichas minor TaxID=65739 RepID=UPI003F738A42
MRGLINYGSYCSINSVVQCLRGTRELRDLIRDIDEAHCDPTKNMVAGRLKRLIYEMTENSYGPCDPSFLVDSMSRYKGFSFDVQEDSDLVFGCILEALTDDGGPAKRIGQLWDITMEKRIRCRGCNTVTYTLDYANSIPVHMEEDLPNELQDYINFENTLTPCDCQCEKCHTKNSTEITTKVLSLPSVLCIKLVRVKNIGRDTAHMVKTEKRFTFPKTLDLKDVMKEPEAVVDALYELYAVIAHSGTHYCGHYTAYVREEDSWYLLDDTQVRLCSWEDVKTTYEARSTLYDGVAYMLMYRRNNRH